MRARIEYQDGKNWVKSHYTLREFNKDIKNEKIFIKISINRYQTKLSALIYRIHKSNK